MKNIKNKTLYLLIFVLFFSFWSPVLAKEECSSNGYTVITINGMIANLQDAKNNKDAITRTLRLVFGKEIIYNNQTVSVDYIHNETHLAGIGDFIDSANQKAFEGLTTIESYDFVNMINDLNKKLKTQKVLFVAHSQGNFYANDIYNKVAGKEGGIPKESIGIYGIASPADYVAGGGKYITSSTDGIINLVRLKGTLKVLKANVDIDTPINNENLKGHSLSKVYLKYEGDRIASDIVASLKLLKNNDKQKSNEPCVSAMKITLLHKITKDFYAIADPTADIIKKVPEKIYKTTKYLANSTAKIIFKTAKGFKGLLASAAGGISKLISPKKVLNKISLVTAIPKKTNIPIIEKLKLKKTKEKETKMIEKVSTLKLKLTKPTPSTSAKSNISVVSKTTIIPQAHPVVFHGGGGGGAVIPPETTLPIITLNGNTPINLILNNTYIDLGATAIDDTDGDITVNIIKAGDIVDTSSIGTYTITYNVSDSALNPAIEVSRIVNVVAPDTTAPVITLVGNSNINITQNNTYADQGATAIDDTDGTILVITTGSVDTSTVAVYTITYTATDLAGNIATINRTINVNAPLPDLIINTDTTLGAGEYSYNNVSISNNATLTLEGDPLSINTFKGVKINATNLTVNSGSSISAYRKGYKNGPGTSSLPQSGGSYGGDGSSNTDNLKYGSAIAPSSLGSGGTGNQNGGGAIQIVVTDTLTNNGTISSDGYSNASGGSIYITTKNLAGVGEIKADGGGLYSTSIYYMPGGGGRIAIYYENSTFTGVSEAKGGCGSLGTPVCGADGTVGLFDTTNNDLYITSSWQFRNTDSPFNFHNIYISDGAEVSTESGVNITASNIYLSGGSSFVLSNSDTINTNVLKVDGSSTLTLSGEETINTQNINVLGNSTITVLPEKVLSITVLNLNIESGSLISANRKGYKNGPGTGTGSTFGGSYGGLGRGNNLNTIYGSATTPIDLGSGGGARQRAGGAIRLIVTDTLTNEGIISSDGYSNASGGSIYITTKNLVGAGKIEADGGNLYTASGFSQLTGGGGRIAIYYEDSTFTGTALAKGICWEYGCAGDGTVGLFDTTNNDLYITSSWQFRNTDSPFTFHNIYISDGAQVSTESGVNITASNMNVDGGSTFTLGGGEIFNINNFNILGNSSVSILPEKVLSITVPSLNIEAGSTISSDAKGLIIGPGTPDITMSSGSSYGGLGGGATAKPIYGSSTIPIDFGSGDGYKRGGGSIKLFVSGTLTNNGTVSSSASDNFVSGGSIYVKAGIISGSGIFKANGGGSISTYGSIGGGGGRIALHYNQTFSFSGTTSIITGTCSYGCTSGGGSGTVEQIDDSIIVLSSEKKITSFNFSSLVPEVVGVIDETNHTVSLTAPSGTDVTNLIPTITYSTNSSVSPLSAVATDFTNSVTYIVTAEDSSTVDYIVTVTISPDTTPPIITLNGNTPVNLTLNDTYTDLGATAIDDTDGDITVNIIKAGDIVDTSSIGTYTITYNVSDSALNPAIEVSRIVNVVVDTTAPSITNYTLNGVTNTITTNPLSSFLNMSFTSSENVNWMSIKIESETDSSYYKIFQSSNAGGSCPDGGNICLKTWNGVLSSGGLLHNDTYRLKVHIKDPAGNEYYDYLPSKIIIDIPL